MSDKLKLGILTSGNQSNARLIIKACLEDRINADVPIIISDDANSGASDDVNSEAIDKVSESNQNQAISSKNSVLQQNLLSLIAGERRLSDESDILQEMVNSKIDLIVLVGYVRKLTPEFFNLYNNKIVDLFPADTRKYRGVNAYEWAWLNKLNATCATVHFVESLNNTGPIILQAPIQIKPEYGSLEEFKNVLEERVKNPSNAESIDTTFFGSLVKIHREGEGATYTGIKPAGDFGSPLIPLVDGAIDSESSEKLEALFPEALRAQVVDRFQEVIGKKNYPLENVPAGRDYVESYIVFFHWALNLYNASLKGEVAHATEGEISHNEEVSHTEEVLDAHER